MLVSISAWVWASPKRPAVHSILFTGGKDRLGHFKLAKLFRERDQRFRLGFSLGHQGQAIPQCEQRVERNQALRFQDRTHAISDFFPYLGAIRTGRLGPRHQFNDLVLRHLGLPRRRAHEFGERGSGGIVKLRGGMDVGKGMENPLPGIILIRRGNLSLARQDLPEAALGLKNSCRLGSHGGIRDAVDGLRGVDECRLWTRR